MNAYLKQDDNIKASVDWMVILIYVALIFCGWISIYAASYQFDQDIDLFDLSGRAGMQLIWIGISMVFAFVLLKLDSNVYDVFAYFVYAFFIVLLFVTIFVAPDIKGSRSWLVITNSIRLQPAEFAKFAVALALARFINGYNFKLMTLKNMSIIIAMIGLPIVLIFLQKETGSALVYLAFVLMLYREGLPGIVLVLGICAVIFFILGLKFSAFALGILGIYTLIMLIATGFVFSYKKDVGVVRNIIIGMCLVYGVAYIVSLFVAVPWDMVALGGLAILFIYLLLLAQRNWSRSYLYITLFVVFSVAYVSSVDYVFTDMMQSHQQQRILVSLGMQDDLMGAGYNVNQSKIAIGSGGFIGKGFLNGTQTKLKYVPEQDTDFIFCTIGEEHGFIGSVLVILLFLALILRLVYLSERQRSRFGRVYGYCVASVFLFHVAINIGMVIGLTPVIGIPLPFISYGGSSLLGFTILLFIFLRIDMTRKRR